MTNGNVSQMRVCIRVRPPNLAEIESNAKDVVRVVDENFLVFDPKEDDAPEFYKGQRRKLRDLTKRRCKDMKFAFDHVFGADVTQEYVYESSTKDMVDTLISGFNCTVFAYGATGAGKTFTMLGAMDRPGVMYHTMLALYQKISEDEKQQYSIGVSYLEVYNEKIRDLLMPGDDLQLREDPKKGTIVNRLSFHQPKSADELMNMLATGNLNRTQHPTDANKQSSRSHAVFQVFLRQKDRTASMSEQYAMSKMSLIDLAGSERATVTTNRGARFREGANINKSLLALGNCINALADPKHKGHIPYRNSKLTRLLKDSLGGNCRTVMIAAISPSMSSYEDTYSTLRYADRAKNIRSSLTKNIVNVELHVSRYPAVIEKLKKENAALKAKLLKYENGAIAPPPTATVNVSRAASQTLAVDHCVSQSSSVKSVEPPSTRKVPPEQMIKHASEIESLFREKQSTANEVLKASSELKLIEFTTCRRQEEIARISAFTNPCVKEKATCRMERVMAANQARTQHKTSRLEAARRKYDEANSKVRLTTEKMKSCGRELALCLRIQELSAHVRNLESRHDHILKLALKSEAATTQNDSLIMSLLKFTKKQFYLLKDHNIATRNMEEEFEKLQKQVEGAKEVAWADEQHSELEVSEIEANPHTVSAPMYDLPQFESVSSDPAEFLQLCAEYSQPTPSQEAKLHPRPLTTAFKQPVSTSKTKPRMRQLFKTDENISHPLAKKSSLRSSRTMMNLHNKAATKKRLNTSDNSADNLQQGSPKRSRLDRDISISAKDDVKAESGQNRMEVSINEDENSQSDENVENCENSSSETESSSANTSSSDTNVDTGDALNSTFTIEPDDTSHGPLTEVTNKLPRVATKRKAGKCSSQSNKKKHGIKTVHNKFSAKIEKLGITSVVATMDALPSFMKPTATSRARALKLRGEIRSANASSRSKRLHRRSKSMTNLAIGYK